MLLIKKLLDIIPLLDNDQDKLIIDNLIKKKLLVKDDFEFDPVILSSFSKMDIGRMGASLINVQTDARNYVEKVFSFDIYNIDYFSEELFDEFYAAENKLKEECMIKRYFFYYDNKKEENKELIKTFDLYCTNRFIDFYTEIYKKTQIKNNA